MIFSDCYCLSILCLLYWCKPKGTILIFGAFNPYPVDVFVQYKNIESADTFDNLVTLLSDLVNNGAKKIFVIGGAQIYNVFWELATALHITYVNENCIDADTIFPFSMDEIEKEFNLKSTKQLTSFAIYQYSERI